MKANILVSWIGHHDLWGLDVAIGDQELTQRIEAIVEKPRPPGLLGAGPIKTLVSQRQFGEIHFLSQWQDEVVKKRFIEWLKVHANFIWVGKDRLSNPTCYEQVFKVAKSELEGIRKENPKGQLHILLSPGTPTMAAVWVLLGKTSFPATFFQTHNGKVTEEIIPFDITLDVIPEYWRNADTLLQHLTFAGSGESEGFKEIQGKSKVLELAKHRAQRAAIRDVTVLLTGESGTGKEMFGRAMHRASVRGRNDPRYEKFQAVNCAAIPRDLLESELFGHEKGSFTGADKQQIGAFERANGGTLFLDEVGELSSENQAKVLRALQPLPEGRPCERLIRRVGGKENIRVNVRVIAATNRDLIDAVSKDQFRDDLFYRLSVIQVRLPSLRDRRTDITDLASFFLDRLNSEFRKEDPHYVDRKLGEDAVKRLRRHNWPGNIRELQNVLTQAAVFSLSGELTAGDIDSGIASFEYRAEELILSRTRGENFSLLDRLDEIEKIFIQDAMSESNNNQTAAAKLLGISQQALSKKLRQT